MIERDPSLELKPPVNAPISEGGEYGLSRPTKKNPNRTHNGIDYRVPKGTPVKASEGGKVVRASDNSKKPEMVVGKDGKPKEKFIGSYGNVVIIDHAPYADDVKLSKRPKQYIYTLYAHLDKMDVKLGDMVYTGQVIGTSGNTGTIEEYEYKKRRRKTQGGFHLHYEVIDNGRTKLEWRAEGATGYNGDVGRKNPNSYLNWPISVKGALSDLEEEVYERVYRMMDVDPFIDLERGTWHMDVMVDGKKVGRLDKHTKEIKLSLSPKEQEEILRKPVPQPRKGPIEVTL